MRNRLSKEDFDFSLTEPNNDLLNVKKNQISNSSPKKDLLIYSNYSFDVSDTCLMIRYYERNKKMKTYYYLSSIKACNVSKTRSKPLLAFTILFFLLGIGGSVPAAFFISFYAFIIFGGCLLVSLIFLIAHYNSKKLEFKIKIEGQRKPKYFYSKNIELYGPTIKFIDELFYKRGKLPN